MENQVAALVRAHRAEIESGWTSYILAMGSRAYEHIPRADIEPRVAAALDAFLALLEHGRDAELRAFCDEIGRTRMAHGFPLRDLHQAMLGFRDVLTPLLLPAFPTPSALLSALGQINRCTDAALGLLTETYRRIVLSEIRQLGSLLFEEEVELRSLRQANEFKTEFVSNVSHELRNPLTAILGYVRMLLRQQAGEVTPLQREFLETVERNADRLLHLVNDLLDISRIECGKLELHWERFDIAHVVEGVVESFRGIAGARRVTLNVLMPEGVRPLIGDPERISQVLSNLVANAIKYGPEGAPVEIRVDPGADEVVLRVTDQGRGISPEDQERLFQKFSRLDNEVTRQTKGTGLGLAIARSLVEMHGGRIWVDSAPGKGSTFCFSLPYLDSPPDPA